MHDAVEISHHHDAWRIQVRGEPQQGGYRTLEEAIEIAWGIAARLRVAISVGQVQPVAA